LNPFIITRHGHQVNFLKPDPTQIDIRDIAHALSRIPRFNAHTIQPLYVAQHLCVCHDNAPAEHRREAFAHDWQEYACSDLNSPLKSLLPQYSEIEQRLERVIARKWRLTYPWAATVKEIDLRSLLTEMRDCTNRTDWREYPAAPFDEKIVPWDSARCHREFMKRYRRLFN
jgi:5'-deoxynucleotidase YfbR-like HD superfamily hydrolase